MAGVQGVVFLLGRVLSLDAAAAAAARGMSSRRRKWMDGVLTSASFGLLQAAMPIIGYLCGKLAAGDLLKQGGRLISAGILLVLGARMIFEREPEEKTSGLSGYMAQLLSQAVATSIDALAVGVGLAGLCKNIPLACGIIGVITFSICFVSYFAGERLSGCLGTRAARATGGGILIFMGIKAFLG